MDSSQFDVTHGPDRSHGPSGLGRPLVALLVHEGIGPFHLTGPLLVFGDNAFGPSPARLVMCTPQPGLIRTMAGFEIKVAPGLEVLQQADAVLLPGWPSMETPVPEPLRQAVRQAHARGAHLVGLCMGVLVLAQAGLLDERAATTHWARVDALSGRFPNVKLAADQLYTHDGRIWTCAGGASGVDVCLHLLRHLCGPVAAAEVARRIVSAPLRQGAQAQQLARPVAHTQAAGRLHEALDWARQHLDEYPGLADMARRAGLSVRAFTRSIQRTMGTSWGRWLLHQRLLRAQELLSTTEDTVDAIATQVGFASAASLRQHFRGHLGVTPREYRAGVGSVAVNCPEPPDKPDGQGGHDGRAA